MLAIFSLFQKSTIDGSVVLFAPRSYRNAFLYPDQEGVSTTQSYQHFFNRLFQAESSNAAQRIMQKFSNVAGT